MKLLALIVIYPLLVGFTMDLRWFPNSDTHDNFIIEYKPENGGWRLLVRVNRDMRQLTITKEEPGAHCYRVRAEANNEYAIGRSGPSQIQCGFN